MPRYEDGVHGIQPHHAIQGGWTVAASATLALDGQAEQGQPGDLLASRPDPAIYHDAAYAAELQRRDALVSRRPPAYVGTGMP